jgi:hypothetical protein
MFKEDKFNYDIENMKKDFAIENMSIDADEVNMLKKFSNNEITVNEMVDSIKNSFKTEA